MLGDLILNPEQYFAEWLTFEFTFYPGDKIKGLQDLVFVFAL